MEKKITIGYDIDKKRVKSLISGIDKNLEFDKNKLSSSKFLSYTNDIKDIKSSNCFIITVPTPVDDFKKPDLKPLFDATKMVAKIIKKRFNNLRVYGLSRLYRGRMCSFIRKILRANVQ